MTKLRRQTFVDLATLLAAIIAHHCLHRYLADANVAATLLAAGTRMPKGLVVLAAFFVLLRIFVVGILPGYVLCRLWLLALTRRQTDG